MIQIEKSSWGWFEKWGKNSKQKPPQPNIIQSLESIVGLTREVEDKSQRKKLTRYVEQYNYTKRSHMLLEFSHQGSIYYYSHMLVDIESGPDIVITFVDAHRQINRDIVIGNYVESGLFIEHVKSIGEFEKDIFVYCSKETDVDSVQVSSLPLDVFGGTRVDSFDNLKQVEREDVGVVSRLGQMFSGGGGLPEPVIIYLEDSENNMRFLQYAFDLRNVDILADTSYLKSVLDSFVEFK